MHRIPENSKTSRCQHGTGFYEQHAIGALFRDFGEEYIQVFRPPLRIIKVIRAIRVCRTPALGGKKFTCKDCGKVRFQFFSCGHSHCPQCQGIKRLQWQDKLAARMLNVPYSHITFTMPHQLNALARKHPDLLYNILFRAAWKTISLLCADKNNLGARPGMTAVLHTWGSDLKYHVHLHCLVTFGGLDLVTSDKWIFPHRKFKIAPFRQFSGLFRTSFLQQVQEHFLSGKIQHYESFELLKAALCKKRWVVNLQRPTADTKVIEEYLGRYICRIGISNKRLQYDPVNKTVLLTFNDYRKQEAGKPAPTAFKNLHPLVAIGQILQHIAPAGFQRVRHYGLHAAATFKKYKDRIPQAVKRNGITVRTIIQILKALLKEKPFCCENCTAEDFWEETILPDRFFKFTFLQPADRSPPNLKGYRMEKVSQFNPGQLPGRKPFLPKPEENPVLTTF
jgi:hypothetical protein